MYFDFPLGEQLLRFILQAICFTIKAKIDQNVTKHHICHNLCDQCVVKSVILCMTEPFLTLVH